MNKGAEPNMYYAAIEGYIDIVALMLDNGAKDFTLAFIGAYNNGYIDIAKLINDNRGDREDLFIKYVNVIK